VTGLSPDELPADPRDALIREQAERLAAQAEQIAALEAMVADLRERLAAAERAGSRNSGNSSMPPSSDDLPGRRPPRKQRPAADRAEKKKRGKQPGSPGASMSWQVPDRIQDHYPQGSCPCGPDLADAAGLLAVCLVIVQHVPAERCRQLIADVAGAVVSDGFIHSCLAKAASLAADAVALIRALITTTPGGSTSPGTRRASRTYCATSRTAPRATRAPSGPCRPSGHCAA
jgi:hypothetical protein